MLRIFGTQSVLKSQRSRSWGGVLIPQLTDAADLLDGNACLGRTASRDHRKPYSPDQLIALNGIHQADAYRAHVHQVLFSRA